MQFRSVAKSAFQKPVFVDLRTRRPRRLLGAQESSTAQAQEGKGMLRTSVVILDLLGGSQTAFSADLRLAEVGKSLCRNKSR